MQVPTLPKAERRFLETDAPAVTGRKVTGYALLFESRSDNLGGREPWVEVISKDALPDLATQDVLALNNHNENSVLARSRFGKGSLILKIDGRGLKYEFEAPNTTAGNDLLESIKRGDIAHSSFAFVVADDGAEWNMQGDIAVRRINRILSILDVSPVVRPAYSSTSVSARSMAGETEHFSVTNARAALEILSL